MKIKVCGMKNPENIKQIGKLPIDYMGLIFYPKSPRYINNLGPELLKVLPNTIERVGVFVNEELETVLQQIEKYKLNQVQLHGTETPEYCLQCWNLSNVEIIKAFPVSSPNDFEQTKSYEEVCQYFLFDTKTDQYGGSGQKFDWTILKEYQGNIPFFLSGGISPEDAEEIKKIQHPKFYGVDLNSKFEIEPGIKNSKLLETFIKKLKK